MKMKKQTNKRLIYILIPLPVLFLVIFFLFSNIFYFSYYSAMYGCNLINETLEEKGMVKLGEYINEEVIVYCNPSQTNEEYQSILKHELCHKKQNEEGREANCISLCINLKNKYCFPYKVFINELECYMKERL